MFSIGDRVVHPMHGAGIIDGIVQEKINGCCQEYYVFKMPIGGLLLKIPIANSQLIGLRSIVDRAQAEQVIQDIPSLQVDMTSNWNRRYRENMERLKSGDLYEVARVIKGLMRRDSEKGLSTGERKMLHSAKQILISEIVLTEGTEYSETEGRINRAVMAGTASGAEK